jgi:hypothetical protein
VAHLPTGIVEVQQVKRTFFGKRRHLRRVFAKKEYLAVPKDARRQFDTGHISEAMVRLAGEVPSLTTTGSFHQLTILFHTCGYESQRRMRRLL